MSKLNLPVNSYDHHLGNAGAAITLIEYGDFECPHCKHAHSLIKQLLNEKGHDIHFIFRHFPIREIHPYAYAAAITAEAAGRQGKFWEMHDQIFQNQDRLNTKFLTFLPKELGLNMNQFAKDSKSNETLSKIEMDFESGVESGINAVPGFFINGLSLITYDETYESLLDAVLLELEIKQ